MKDRERTHKEVGLVGAVLILLMILFIMVMGKLVLNFDTGMLVLIVAMATTIVYVGVYRFTWDFMFKEGVIPMVARASGAILILLIVGPMIAIWMAAGTVPYMINFGLSILKPQTFLVSACLVCAISSILTGTSWGSAATFGVAFMGIGHGLGISPAATAGAIIAGSYFGDKVSPISDTTVLAAATAETDVVAHIRSMLWTTVPAFCIGLAVYAWAGSSAAETMDMTRINEIVNAINGSYKLTPLVLIPAVLLLILAFMGFPTIPVLWASMVSAVPLAMMQGHGLSDIVKIMASGPKAATGLEVVDKLLSRGGLSFMSSSVTVVFFAYIFAGQLECTGTIRVVTAAMKERFIRSSIGRLVFSTSLTGLITALGTGNSYLSIIMPGTMYRDLFDGFGIQRRVLSRTLEDSGTVFVPLIPWSAAGVYMYGLFNVPVLEYAPWAVMCYCGFLLAWLYAFCGFAIFRAEPKDGSQAKGSKIAL